MNKLINYFPKKYKPYDHQTSILTNIESLLDDKKCKYIIIQAPTGSGKSLLSATLALSTSNPSSNYVRYIDEGKIYEKNHIGECIYEHEFEKEPDFGAFVLTTSKTLQNQYNKLFEDCTILKGKQNYTCNLDNGFKADLAPCSLANSVFKKCLNDRTCEYYNLRNYALKNRFTVLNYSVFLNLPEFLRRRQYIVCDEASELEDEIVDHFSAHIEYSKFSFIKDKLLTEDSNQAYNWLNDLLIDVNDEVNDLTKILSNKKHFSIDKAIKLRQYKQLQEKLSMVSQNWYNCEYIIEKDADAAHFIPLRICNLTEHIFKHAKKIILMSATIIDPKTFAKTLGIKDYQYVETKSVFNPKKAPIYCPGKHNLNYSNINKNLPKVVDDALQICNHFKDSKGVIHAHNFKIVEAIRKQTKRNNRFLYREGNITNEHILDEHFLRKDPTILVSPSLSFGIDLPGHKFQIIIKLPYLPLGSKRILRLFKEDPEWYQMKMLITLSQMCGRIIRSVNDEGSTFILDGQAVSMIKSNWDKLPEAIKERLQ